MKSHAKHLPAIFWFKRVDNFLYFRVMFQEKHAFIGITPDF